MSMETFRHHYINIFNLEYISVAGTTDEDTLM